MQTLFNLAVLSLLIPAYFVGWLDMVLESDKTYISILIFILVLVGLVSSLRGKWSLAVLIEGLAPYLGLVGTVVGFIIALQGIDLSALDSAASAKQIGAQLAYGLGTALYTTLVGSMGYLWLTINRHFFS